MTNIEIPELFYAHSACVCSFGARWRDIKRSASRNGAVRKRCEVLRNLTESSLQVVNLHGYKFFKMVPSIKVPIRRDKSVMVLKKQDLPLHVKRIEPRFKLNQV